MKKLHFFFFVLVIILFTSCSKADLMAPTTDAELVEYSFDIRPVNSASTRAEAPAVPGYDVRYMVEVWKEDNSARVGLRQVQLNNPSFSVLMDKKIANKIVVWVDYVDDVANDDASLARDKFYDTTDLKIISIIGVGTNPVNAFAIRVFDQAEIPPRDVFTNSFSIPVDGSPDPSLQVKRPFARIDVIATDVENWKTQTSATQITFSIKSAGFFQFNALTQLIFGTCEIMTFTNTISNTQFNDPGYTGNQLIVSGLYFAPSTYIGSSAPSLFLIGNSTASKDIEVPDVPYQRNYITKLTGNVIYETRSFTIDVNSVYEGPDLAKDPEF